MLTGHIDVWTGAIRNGQVDRDVKRGNENVETYGGVEAVIYRDTF
jgi:hypothetical protein